MRSPNSAAIDIGTHSTRLLIGYAENDRVKELHRATSITRLGEGIENKEINKAAFERVGKVLAGYLDLIKEHHVQNTIIACTSAVRDASNKADFLKFVKYTTGVTPKILPGVEEAGLTFQGVFSDLSKEEKNMKVLVVDIGGGSTELIIGSRGKVDIIRSLDIGCLRLREKFLLSDPPGDEEAGQLMEYIESSYKDAIDVFAVNFQIAVAVAGTSTALAAIKLGLEHYDRMKIHRTILTKQEIKDMNKCLSVINLSERKKVLAMEPDRADVIVAGGLILEYLMNRLNIDEIIVFESDILDGLLLSL